MLGERVQGRRNSECKVEGCLGCLRSTIEGVVARTKLAKVTITRGEIREVLSGPEHVDLGFT